MQINSRDQAIVPFLLLICKSFWTIYYMQDKHSSPQEDTSSVKFLFCEEQGLKSKFDPYASDNLNLVW